MPRPRNTKASAGFRGVDTEIRLDDDDIDGHTVSVLECIYGLLFG